MTPEQERIVHLFKEVDRLNARICVMDLALHTAVNSLRSVSPEAVGKVLELAHEQLETWRNMDGAGASAGDAVDLFKRLYPVADPEAPKPRPGLTVIDGGASEG